MRLPDPRMERWAKTLVSYCGSVKPGDKVAIVGTAAATPLLRELHHEVLLVGALPVMATTVGGEWTDLLAYGNDDQLSFISPIERFANEEADVLFRIGGELNTRSTTTIDPSRQRRFAAARAELQQTFYRRSATRELRWVDTLYPTDAHAQDAEMSTEEYTAFLFAACKLDQPDPVAAWSELRAEQQRLIDWLAGKSEVRLVGEGTDLTLSIAGRTWLNSDGRRNFPSGEIFTGPIEDSANGTVQFSFPVVTAGREISNVRLRFAHGKIVDAHADKHEAYLNETLDSDAGARFLGEFAFGTNYGISKFTRNILLDEKIGGTVHLAAGAGYPETGSQNRSAIHWDMICDLRQGGLVTIDGEPFLQDGRFLV